MTTDRRGSATVDATWGDIEWVVSQNNLREGGRARAPQEVYLNIRRRHLEYLYPDGDRFSFRVKTSDGQSFEALCSGSPDWKNLRSRPVTALGDWLLDSCHAQPGDLVRARWEADRQGSYLALRHVVPTAVVVNRKGGRK